MTRGLCVPTNGRTVSISTVPSGPTGLNGSPGKRNPEEEFAGAGWALTTGPANFLSLSISAHTLVVAGSMYPPKIIGLIGLPLLAASIATWMFPAGAANAFLPCFNMAAPATEAFRSSRRFIGMSSLLVFVKRHRRKRRFSFLIAYTSLSRMCVLSEEIDRLTILNRLSTLSRPGVGRNLGAAHAHGVRYDFG
ncbi:MAG: hypothetical protein ABSG79_05710 [Bryobacteraceae bacterium]